MKLHEILLISLNRNVILAEMNRCRPRLGLDELIFVVI